MKASRKTLYEKLKYTAMKAQIAKKSSQKAP
jgi:hypothetical protein